LRICALCSLRENAHNSVVGASRDDIRAPATEFITKAQAAPALEANTGEKARAAVRQSTTTMAIEARPAAAAADAWIHRSVLAK
jgi:hypothetical protein